MTRSGLSYLAAARRREIDELEQLACTGAVVATIGRLVHALQRERGASNLLLASGGQRFGAQRLAQAAQSLQLEADVRTGFDQLAAAPLRHGPRLLSRIAWAVSGLDALPALRRRIAALEIDVAASTAAFVKLIAGLLAVVYEAADGASDPAISRLLAAMFSFLQAKEYAGQERACGAAAFAAATIDAARREQWQQLVAAQERSFALYAELAGPALAEWSRERQPAAELAETERLRALALAAPDGGALDPELAAVWFDCCTLRIDAMQAVDERLRADLQALCAERIAQARAEAESHEALLARSPGGGGVGGGFFDAGPGDDVAQPGRHAIDRSVLDLLQQQSQRIQAMADELDAVRESLRERKLVERAKGLLMARRQLTEPEAHRLLRQTAMNQNRRIVDVAESVLATAELLPAGA